MKRISDCGKYQLSKVDGELTLTNIATKYYCNINHTYGEVAGNEDICIDVITEDGVETTLVFFAHPWYGLKDSKGWITRYPNTCDSYGNKLISREWIVKFLELGGSIDGCGVWGIDPYASWVEAQSAEAIVHLLEMEHAHRWDNISHDVLHISKAGLIISSEINWPSFKALALGVRRIQTCIKAGITTTKTVMQLGWMKLEKFNYFVAQNATKYPKGDRYKRSQIAYGDFFGVRLSTAPIYSNDGYSEWDTCFDDSGVTNPIWHKAKRDCLKYSTRTKLRVAANTYTESVLYCSSNIEKLLPSIIGVSGQIWYGNIPYSSKLRTYATRINMSTTSAGRVYYSGSKLFMASDFTDKNFHEISTRKIGNYSVAKIANTCFAWVDSFQNHVEGASVKEAITKLEGKRRIKGLVMSLNDIRTNASFCFAGTKQFLADRMRHVYNLVKDFSSWSELPEEIANIQWELASRDIFAGYPEP